MRKEEVYIYIYIYVLYLVVWQKALNGFVIVRKYLLFMTVYRAMIILDAEKGRVCIFLICCSINFLFWRRGGADFEIFLTCCSFTCN